MDWDQFIQALFQEADPYLRARGDYLHTKVAHEYALLLLKAEGGDNKIVEPAVILHDVGWSAIRPEEMETAYGIRAVGEKAAELNRLHEKAGAEIARKMLLKLDYRPSLIDKVTQIIERHDSGKAPHTVEEKIVKDADKLWRFSKVGYEYEMKRQHTSHEMRYRFLKKRTDTWFFTTTAKKLAKREIKERSKEYDGHHPNIS